MISENSIAIGEHAGIYLDKCIPVFHKDLGDELYLPPAGIGLNQLGDFSGSWKHLFVIEWVCVCGRGGVLSISENQSSNSCNRSQQVSKENLNGSISQIQ